MMDARERLERMTDEACEMFDACIVPKEIQAALRELGKDMRKHVATMTFANTYPWEMQQGYKAGYEEAIEQLLAITELEL